MIQKRLKEKDRSLSMNFESCKADTYKSRGKSTTKVKPERTRKLKDQRLKEKEIASALGVTERMVFRYLEGTV